MKQQAVYCLSLIGLLSLNPFCGSCLAQNLRGPETPQLDSAPQNNGLRGPMNNDFTQSAGTGDGSWRGAPAQPQPPVNNNPVAPFSGGNNMSSYSRSPAYNPDQPQPPVTPYTGGKYKNQNGLVGTTLGAPEKATKSAVGLTDRSAKTAVGVTGKAAKTAIGVPGKAVKEMFKAIF